MWGDHVRVAWVELELKYAEEDLDSPASGFCCIMRPVARAEVAACLSCMGSLPDENKVRTGAVSRMRSSLWPIRPAPMPPPPSCRGLQDPAGGIWRGQVGMATQPTLQTQKSNKKPHKKAEGQLSGKEAMGFPT
jgi:hypothetical protein